MRLTRLAWSPDGKLLAIASGTGLYLYDTSSWQETRFLPLDLRPGSATAGGARNVAFSFDGTLVATEGQTVQVWRVADGAFAYSLAGQQAQLSL